MSEISNYIPSPTATTFHNDLESDVRFVMGCVGGGKTTMCCWEMFFTSCRQAPDANGKRRTRWVVIRNTFPELKSTVIKTWEEWFGGICTTVFDVPIRSNIYQQLPDGTTLDMEVYFLALNDAQSVKKLRSLEVTGAYISEASEIAYEIFEILPSRLRWPSNSATWHGIILESNPPSASSWLYDMFEVRRPKGHAIFKQPPPLIYDKDTNEYHPNPLAENIKYLQNGYEYYFRQVLTATEEYINVYVLGQYGTSFAGKPVFPQFAPSSHIPSETIRATAHSPIIIGMDFGLQPAAVFTQLSPTGQLMIYDELVGEDVTLEDFVVEHLIPKLQQKYPNTNVMIVGDPAGKQRSALAKMNTFQTLQKYGIAAKPAPTNDIVPRIEAVMYFMKRTGGFYVNNHCTQLIEGLKGGYRYMKRRNNDLTSEFQDTPDKNKYSHVADALQYAALYHQQGSRLNKRPKRAKSTPFKYA